MRTLGRRALECGDSSPLSRGDLSPSNWQARAPLARRPGAERALPGDKSPRRGKRRQVAALQSPGHRFLRFRACCSRAATVVPSHPLGATGRGKDPAGLLDCHPVASSECSGLPIRVQCSWAFFLTNGAIWCDLVRFGANSACLKTRPVRGPGLQEPAF
jgi:hypothetical protein